MPDLITIDGSRGEGGGQILRTSLALSVITGRPFSIQRIRANRPKPGLRRQHLTAVRAAAAICNARLTGDAVDSTELTFVPGQLAPGDYHFDVGSAGSTMLVLQTVLPPLMIAGAPSTLLLEGGTHNFGAPPFPFLQKTFLPLLSRMGPQVTLELLRAGFAPAGGGKAAVHIQPAASLKSIQLLERGEIVRRAARVLIAGLPDHIAQREIDALREELSWPTFEIEKLPGDQGPGNLMTLEIESSHLTEVVTAFGQRGINAERVARSAAEEARHYIGLDVPVGEHLADQLLLPLALARGGAYLTGPLTPHATTNIETIQHFLDVRIHVEALPHDHHRITVG